MNRKSDEGSQADKFRELARELDCDENEVRFEEAVRKIANAPPPKPEKGSNGEPH